MRLADKIATMARRSAPLPYKRRLAYLTNNPTDAFHGQYINTGLILGNTRSSVEVKFKYNGITSWVNQHGNFTLGASDSELWRFGANTTNFRYVCQPEISSNMNVKQFDMDWHTVILNSQEGSSFDGVTFDQNRHLVGNVGELCFFCRGGNMYGQGMVSIAYAKVCDESSNIIMSLIPVFSLDDEPCMYDEVSGQLFRNSGTGTFGYAELET